jgi:hypothetical protein
MSDTIRDYILEKAETSREEIIAFGKVDVKIDADLPENINLGKVLYIVRSTLPENYFHGLRNIFVTEEAQFAERDINAFYKDMSLYISPDQDNERDLIDDIVHEMAHHMEVIAPEEIYADRTILEEFITKRKQLEFELRTEGYDTSEYDFEEAAFNKGFDFFLHKRVGYKALNYIALGLFLRPYAITSVREYFASGFEAFYLGKKSELSRTCPVLYKKIDELHDFAS